MKFEIHCPKCKEKRDIYNCKIINIYEEGVIDIVCDKGHETCLITDFGHPEILFQIGINAIIDGYYREAVTSFSSSLERFYGYVIEIICIHYNIDIGVYSKCWRKVKNQSERQFGAYVFLWGLHMNSEPPSLDTNLIGYRNAVVHKGEFPNQEKSEEYGESVYEVIKHIVTQMHEAGLGDTIQKFVMDQAVKNTQTNIEAGKEVFGAGIFMVLGLLPRRPSRFESTFKEQIVKTKDYRAMISDWRES